MKQKTLKDLVNTNMKYKRLISSILYSKLKIVALLSLILFIGGNTYCNQLAFLDDVDNQSIYTCKSDRFNITVDLKDGWRVEDKYFIKTDNRVLTSTCKVKEEGDSDEW